MPSSGGIENGTLATFADIGDGGLHCRSVTVGPATRVRAGCIVGARNTDGEGDARECAARAPCLLTQARGRERPLLDGRQQARRRRRRRNGVAVSDLGLLEAVGQHPERWALADATRVVRRLPCCHPHQRRVCLDDELHVARDAAVGGPQAVLQAWRREIERCLARVLVDPHSVDNDAAGAVSIDRGLVSSSAVVAAHVVLAQADTERHHRSRAGLQWAQSSTNARKQVDERRKVAGWCTSPSMYTHLNNRRQRLDTHRARVDAGGRKRDGNGLPRGSSVELLAGDPLDVVPQVSQAGERLAVVDTRCRAGRRGSRGLLLLRTCRLMACVRATLFLSDPRHTRQLSSTAPRALLTASCGCRCEACGCGARGSCSLRAGAGGRECV